MTNIQSLQIRSQKIALIGLVGIAGLFSLAMISNAHCPKNFTHAAENVSIICVDRTATYCEAHQICEKEGKKLGLRLFIPGYNAPKISYLFSDLGLIFTSLSAMLNRSNDHRAGWRVGDPGYTDFVTKNADTTIPWYKDEPNADGPAIGLYSDRHLFDYLQADHNASRVICEISSRPTEERLERFQANWPYRLDTLFVGNTKHCGCFDAGNATTLLECAKRCKQRTECRSFYFHKPNRECMLSLYVDSLLPLAFAGEPSAWVRYGRPDW
ncbi:hypothetical protein FGIG_10255 [Fasciola gigantica]|uniref:Apple domain-containing protein n=1 Tax=Fasciola gigantica TaxID=46835 RepID=A0A504YKJ4_FASGI|nr:hypothetical protein FGIG_10255 [Fasciola gigantica]